MEHAEDLIAHHLDLAHRPVAGVDGDGSIGGIDGPRRDDVALLGAAFAGGAAMVEREDVRLQRPQHRRYGGLDVEIAIVFEVVDAPLEHVLKIAPDAPEGGEERLPRVCASSSSSAPPLSLRLRAISR